MVDGAVAAFRDCDMEGDWGVVEQVFAVVLQLGLQVVDQVVFAGQLLVELEVIEEQARPDLECARW